MEYNVFLINILHYFCKTLYREKTIHYLVILIRYYTFGYNTSKYNNLCIKNEFPTWGSFADI
jgi:hypothetical protein